MVDLTKDVHSLTAFKRDTAGFLRRMRRTGDPLVLTVNGKPEVVALDVRTYQAMVDAMDMAEAVRGVSRGLKSFAEGKGRPAQDALEGIRSRHAIPR